ncbi:DET1- and DDB1-associated protein 1 [Zeugodacus cucurbitae]|uniref:DET1- and DDB1-associated protein 1 n=1 Tax=Zeugodacus cucurbitae TaxID=28588 RepID=UPI0005969151|nr:DET1- and DDB1-associated protein 1 [Zeugodacus cucurbitae]
MSVAEFLKDLPSHNAQNFSQFNMEHGLRTSQKRPSVYLPTEDVPSEQHIVMDKRCVLLRYLKQQWDKKTLPRKRDHSNGDANVGNGTANNSCKKRPRLDINQLV